MENNTTAVDYDRLLTVFLSKADWNTALKQANTVGDKTYSTDGHALIIIPNSLLNKTYLLRNDAPNYQSAIDQITQCVPASFKDTDLFKALGSTPKYYDESECKKCDGDGKCFHCDADCYRCNGSGMVEDKSKPMVYSERATI